MEEFLLSALLKFPEKNINGIKKEDQVKQYVLVLGEAELGTKNTLSMLTESLLEKVGVPIGHAIAISEAAHSSCVRDGNNYSFLLLIYRSTAKEGEKPSGILCQWTY